MSKAMLNYELVETMMDSVHMTHHITPNKTRTHLNVINEMYRTSITATQEHHKKQRDYEFIFAVKEYTDKNDFICKEYENITKGLIKSMALKCNVKFAQDIVNKGYYGDVFFYDLCQEVAMVLLDNIDNIEVENNNYIVTGDVKIKCLRALNNYGYANKTRVSNTEVAIIDYDEKNNNDISIAINTRAYKDYCSNVAYNDMFIDDSYKHFITIIRTIKSYIELTEKGYISEKCQKVLDLLIKGYKHKNICEELDITHPTLRKYKNIIQNAYITLYRTNKHTNKTMARLKGDNNKNHYGYITIEKPVKSAFKEYEIHQYKQAIYNELFGVNSDIRISKKGCMRHFKNHNDLWLYHKGFDSLFENKSHYEQIIFNKLVQTANTYSELTNLEYNVDTLQDLKNRLQDAFMNYTEVEEIDEEI